MENGLHPASGRGMLDAMKTYGQFCPVAQALEILAERWTLLVVRELLSGSTRFSEIQRGVPLMSRSLLSQRLKSLQDDGLLERTEGARGPEYFLTEAGRALQSIVESIGQWGKVHAARGLTEEHLDPKLLMWDLQRRLHTDRLPEEPTQILFRFTDARVGERRFWLRMQKREVDLCLTNPGFEVDLTVESDVRTLTEVWMGQKSLASCLRKGSVRLQGPPRLRKAFPGWLMLSTFAD